MVCKRCGSTLPSTGFLCTNCGFMMDAEQIKKQKDYMKLNKQNQKLEMVSERYRHGKALYQKRGKEKNFSFWYIFFFCLFVMLFLLLVVFS